MINTFKLIWRSNKIKQISYNKISINKVFKFRNIICRKILTTIKVVYLQKLTYDIIILYSIYKHNQNKAYIIVAGSGDSKIIFMCRPQILWFKKRSPKAIFFMSFSRYGKQCGIMQHFPKPSEWTFSLS